MSPKQNFVVNPVLTRNIDVTQVRSGVDALLQLVEKTKKVKGLFEDAEPIFLNICCVKVPKVPTRDLRLSLVNPLLTAESEICLIVPDLPKTKDHEETIEYYEELLRLRQVTNIKTILPLHQLKTEYDQFELKRGLVELYDGFLVDGKISGQVVHLLGKKFIEKRKLPTSVRLESIQLKDDIEKALSKVVLNIHSNGDSYSVQIGQTQMSSEAIIENILGIGNDLTLRFPGGFENIRSLDVKTGTSMAVPIYLTLKNKNEVNVPVSKPKRPAKFEQVTGEFEDGSVTVYATGGVYVQNVTADTENVTKRSSRRKRNHVKAETLKDKSAIKTEEQLVNKNSNVDVVKKATKKVATKTKKAAQIKEEATLDDGENEDILNKEEEAYLKDYEKLMAAESTANKTNVLKAKKGVVDKPNKRGKAKKESPINDIQGKVVKKTPKNKNNLAKKIKAELANVVNNFVVSPNSSKNAGSLLSDAPTNKRNAPRKNTARATVVNETKVTLEQDINAGLKSTDTKTKGKAKVKTHGKTAKTPGKTAKSKKGAEVQEEKNIHVDDIGIVSSPPKNKRNAARKSNKGKTQNASEVLNEELAAVKKVKHKANKRKVEISEVIEKKIGSPKKLRTRQNRKKVE